MLQGQSEEKQEKDSKFMLMVMIIGILALQHVYSYASTHFMLPSSARNHKHGHSMRRSFERVENQTFYPLLRGP